MPITNSRLYFAFAAYVAIALLAGFTLDGPFRLAVWIFLAGLAVKTWLLKLRRDQD